MYCSSAAGADLKEGGEGGRGGMEGERGGKSFTPPETTAPRSACSYSQSRRKEGPQHRLDGGAEGEREEARERREGRGKT
jgi:hypothetical protein